MNGMREHSPDPTFFPLVRFVTRGKRTSGCFFAIASQESSPCCLGGAFLFDKKIFTLNMYFAYPT
jgi:hypothetical protein